MAVLFHVKHHLSTEVFKQKKIPPPFSSTGAVCNQGNTEERRSGEEAVRQRAPPAVDELGDDPQAAQNVAGESPRHAPQPVTAAPHTAPPFTCPSSVPLPDSQHKTFFSMESPSPINLPESLPICSNATQGSISEDLSAEESVRVSASLPTSVNEDRSPPSEMQKLSPPHAHPSSDIQINSTVQEVHYGSQTDKEKELPASETKQISPSRESAELLDVTSPEKRSVMSEYKPETAPTDKPGENEHNAEPLHRESQSRLGSAASPSPVQQSSLDTAAPGALALSGGGEHHSCQTGQPDAAEQECVHQDSTSPVLPSSPSHTRNKQTHISQLQPKWEEISNDAKDTRKTSSLESVKMFENNKDLADASDQEPQLPPPETLEISTAGETPAGLYTPGSGDSLSGGAADNDRGQMERSSTPHAGEHVEGRIGKEPPETVVTCASTESSSHPSAAGPLSDTSVSPLTEEVVSPDTPGQVLTTQPPPATELVRSSPETLLVREEANVSGGWSNAQLNPSYLLREDGTVCEAAIFGSQLSSTEPKRYEESFQADIELHSQSVEVYEFCSLVEEVAEETVCVNNSAQAPHSPGYEVNLFNALLENSEDYNEKEDLEPQLKASVHTADEGQAVIISQHPSPLSHDANQTEPSSNRNSHHLSSKNAVEPRSGVDVNQETEMANSSEVPLAGRKRAEGRSSPLFETVLQKKQAGGASAGTLSLIPPVVTGESRGTESSIAVSVHVSHVELQTSGLALLSATETDLTPSQSTESAALSRESQQEASRRSNVLNPKLLLLKQGESPLLKRPSSLLKKVAGQQNVAINLAAARQSRPGTLSTEGVPRVASAADSSRASVALTAQQDQAQCSFNTTADPSEDVQATILSSNMLLVPDQNSPSSSKSDTEALTVCKRATAESDVAPQDVADPDASPPSTPNNVYMVPISAEGGRIVASSCSPTEPVSVSESLYMEEESEDLEQDELMGDSEIQEAEAGQVSSGEEASDEEPDKTDSEMATPSLQYKVQRLGIVSFLPSLVDMKKDESGKSGLCTV